MKKSTFLPNFHIFCTILTFLHQNWYWQKHLSLCLKVCTTLFYHCTWKFTHLPQNWRFLHKMLFFTKRNQCHQKLTLFKNRRYFFNIDIFAPKLILTETLVTLSQSLHDIILSLYLEIRSFAQKLTLFATKNWHLSKTENTPLRILDISIKN